MFRVICSRLLDARRIRFNRAKVMIIVIRGSTLQRFVSLRLLPPTLVRYADLRPISLRWFNHCFCELKIESAFQNSDFLHRAFGRFLSVRTVFERLRTTIRTVLWSFLYLRSNALFAFGRSLSRSNAFRTVLGTSQYLRSNGSLASERSSNAFERCFERF